MTEQKTLEKAQLYQQQLQAIMVQKESLRLQLKEMESALKEMANTREKTIYRITGPLLLKVDKKGVTDELEERKKFINLKINTLEKSEKKLTDELDELRKGLEEPKKKGIKVSG